MYIEKSIEEFQAFTYPEDWCFHEEGWLLYKGNAIFGVYNFDTGTQVYHHNWHEDLFGDYEERLQEDEKVEHILQSIGIIPETYLSQFGTIMPKIWHKFEKETKGWSVKKKFQWMYKETGRKALLALSKDGVVFPKKLLKRYWFYGESKKVYIYDESNFFYYDYRFYPKDHHGYILNDEWYPIEEVINSWKECEECGAIHFRPGNLCFSCSKKYTILDYSTKAESMLPFKNDNEKVPVYLGIELEYENCRNYVRETMNLIKDHAIIKKDGSISNGFEIVTCPATLNVHKKIFKDFFKKSPFLKRESNCGMHVHIDKSTLGEMQRGKILTFITDPDNKKFLTSLAGRNFTNNHYCQVKEKLPITYGITGDESGVTRKGTSKYNAVNMEKGPTIEIRIFAPPKSYAGFMTKMEFVQALVDFTRPCVVSVNDVNLQKFKAFVDKSYPYLKKFMEKF